MAIRAVISDFGGVLTTPLLRSFVAFQDETGISFEALGNAMQRAAERNGAYPLFELEKGNLTEADFLELLRDNLEPELGHRPELHRFKEIYFDALDPNEPMIELMRDLKRRGYRMALLTNNVREWEPLWRSMLPVDEIFELIVDSAFVGMRKPEPGIYRLTLERIGAVAPAECVFVDDTEANCEAARELGMSAVQFRGNDQAIVEIEQALAPSR
jgi:putative hydrolase of the HAD superfamily